jgi:hypothetical protein
MSETMTGGCQCGRIRYSVEIDGDGAELCHCRMCQRATGGVSIALRSVPKDKLVWTQEPERYASSPIARRGFCAQCGTPLTFEFVDGENVDLTVGSFDDPYRFRPTKHFGKESWHERWLDTTRLPAKRTDEHQPLVDKWINAVGKLPD